jgi:hypothetical protein
MRMRFVNSEAFQKDRFGDKKAGSRQATIETGATALFGHTEVPKTARGLVPPWHSVPLGRGPLRAA